jgi:hypothetical protein
MLHRMRCRMRQTWGDLINKFGFKSLKVTTLAEAMVGDAESVPIDPDVVEPVVT